MAHAYSPIRRRLPLSMVIAWLWPSAAFALHEPEAGIATQTAAAPAAAAPPPAAGTPLAPSRIAPEPPASPGPAQRAFVPPAALPRFGDAGQIVITGAASVEGLVSTSVTPHTQLLFRPALDVFVLRNVTLGGAFELSYLKADVETVMIQGSFSQTFEQRTTEWSIAPRAGYNLALVPLASIYFNAGVSFGHTSTRTFEQGGGPLGAALPSTFVAVATSATLMFHLALHFFVGVGPELAIDLKRTAPDSLSAGFDKGATLRVFTTIGGWL